MLQRQIEQLQGDLEMERVSTAKALSDKENQIRMLKERIKDDDVCHLIVMFPPHKCVLSVMCSLHTSVS
jgi:hypothetical protein